MRNSPTRAVLVYNAAKYFCFTRGFLLVFSRRLSFRRVAGLYRRRLSQTIFAKCGGVIRYGPFSGMRWLDNPGRGRSDQGVIVLGLYEQEVLANLVEAPDRYRVFVDLGAADGYYAVGLLYTGKVDRSVAFESLPEYRQAMARLAAENGVSDKLTVLGTASENFIEQLAEQKINPLETMFLIDIEGAEFKVLTEELFSFLKDSLIIVETHAHIYANPAGEMQRLIQKASKTHRATVWNPGGRNPWTIKELEEFAEIDRWILCSEGRMEVQQWLRFDPL
jgi:hypothetical protein